MCCRLACYVQSRISDQLGMQLSIIEGSFIKKILAVVMRSWIPTAVPYAIVAWLVFSA